MRNINNMTYTDLIEGINRMLRGNYKAVRLVYCFLEGFTGGAANE